CLAIGPYGRPLWSPWGDPLAGSQPDMMLDIVRLTFFPAVMAFAAASDLFTMTISNRISLALVVGFALLAALSGMSLHDVGTHLGAGAIVLAFAFTFFAMGWVGGGDA